MGHEERTTMVGFGCGRDDETNGEHVQRTKNSGDRSDTTAVNGEHYYNNNSVGKVTRGARPVNGKLRGGRV